MPSRLAAFAVFMLLASAAHARAQDPIHWQGLRLGGTALAGGTIAVGLDVQIDDGWHLYALSQPPGGPRALEFAVDKTGPFRIVGAIDGPAPSHAFDPNFNIETQYHEERASFRLQVRVADHAANGQQTLRLTVSYQTCNARLCLPPQEEELTRKVIIGAPSPTLDASRAPGAIAPEFADNSRTVEPRTGAAPVARPATNGGSSGVVDLAAASHASTFGAYLWLAAIMGGLSLLTPCVFPMVPITVSYFTRPLRQGPGPAQSRRDAVAQAVVYGAGIVLTFTAVGLTLALVFGASGVNRFAASPWLNLGITALFVGFALSLFGAYNIALPSRLVTVASIADRGRGRLAGTLLMGLAFTLTSFTCTAPFLGTLLVVAAQGDWVWPLAGMLAFSSVFALPFVVLALAPQWVASLPRSGHWLVGLKAAMGLLELAAAIKFLSNVDLVWHWGVFTREVVLALWVLVAIVLVAYLSGVLRLGHAPRLGRPGLARMTAVAAGVALGCWLALGLSGRRLGELEAFLPPADLRGTPNGDELSWVLNDYDAGVAEAARTGRPILIDFTGYTCTNCRWMEANMFPRPDVSRALARYVRVRLYTDGSGEPYRRFQTMEQKLFGTVALPYYAVLGPDARPRVAFGGLTRNPDEFIAFLARGLE